MQTFRVSDVARCSLPLEATTLAASLKHHGVAACEAGAANQPRLVVAGHETTHAFVETVGVAFAQHYPLVLSPDDVWLCLAQGFAAHVDLNAEALRERFVRHGGQLTLVVRRDDFVKGSPHNDWPSVFGEFSDQIASHAGKKRELVVADFSTTGPVERAASEIVLMKAMEHYFRYDVMTLCGIPEITLLGTPDDWRSIRTRVDALSEFELAWWTKPLQAVLHQFVTAAEGRADATFWRSFYKLNDASGGPYVTGWINTLFPYVNVDRVGEDRRIEKVVERNDAVATWSQGMQAPFGGGPKTQEFFAGLSRAPFTWTCFDQKLEMSFLAGFVGVSQDAESGAVRPAIGWAVA
jgi:hypothetical protein